MMRTSSTGMKTLISVLSLTVSIYILRLVHFITLHSLMKRMNFLTRASQTETFDDVLRLSKDVTDFVKATKQEPMQSPLLSRDRERKVRMRSRTPLKPTPEGSVYQAPQEDGQQEPVKNGSIP